MKSGDTIARVRREHFIRHRSIREISRELNVSRKILRSGATEFHYEREVQPLPTIGPWREQLDRLLMTNEGKATRERLTLIRVFEELREAGFKGGYDAVRRYAKAWGKERGSVTSDAYVPLSFAAVETFFKTLKAELIWRHNWATREEVTQALFQFMNGFYNSRRRHSAIGGLTPITFERKIASTRTGCGTILWQVQKKRDHKTLFLALVASWLLGHFCRFRTTC